MYFWVRRVVHIADCDTFEARAAAYEDERPHRPLSPEGVYPWHEVSDEEVRGLRSLYSDACALQCPPEWVWIYSAETGDTLYRFTEHGPQFFGRAISATERAALAIAVGATNIHQ